MSGEMLPNAASSYAMVMSTIGERRHSTKSPRCSPGGMCLPRRRRIRRYCRGSSNAEQKGAADSKFSKPSIG